ncbi:MAG: p-toluenesulfonate methyl-monooxygenase reductase component TsaB [Pseudomonadota bacterium]
MSSLAPTLDLQVRSVRALARDILGIELAAADGRALPGAQAGAHIDLHLPNGLIRQYSLTYTPGTATQASYSVAVGLDANSRGGSSWIHDKLRVGATLRVGTPRNLFALDPTHRRVLLVAGGIGITPIYAMAQSAARAGLDWQLVACARSLSRLAFTEELQALGADRVHLHGDLEAGRLIDMPRWLDAQPWDGVYACGPLPLLAALEQHTAAWPDGRYRSEKFKADASAGGEQRTFELVLARSGLRTEVAPGEQVLDALERLGLDHPYACREGLCGTCECGWLEGEPEHRDLVLDDAARNVQRRFIPCVSRSRGERLTLDL